ncbi:Nisin-resistance protein, family S41 [Zobellia galactanivorans]|uniref:Nisin-resistance protein, family S41 n=3 Tax=Zobellia galactanivorans (strain DSM 12802 / CCUG 47099 / CIP 106680 / NCIMB 13871 / Dsij) TaxID=63186 RepID=G0L7G6_ZOBGA|nr:Nisin-resistance protein, family S41 [Zobellia galactanivorans]
MLHMKKNLLIILVFLFFSCNNNNSAKTYLNSAIDIMEENSIKTENIDWDNLRNTAHKNIEGKKTAEETYSTIENALKELGDNHSFFIPKQPDTIIGESDEIIPSVEAKILNKQIAYLKVPAFNKGGNLANKFATKIQSKIIALDRPEIEGWIIDLSENYGGNMWPMYLGLAPLIGEGISGYFFDWEKNSAEWSFKTNAVYNKEDNKLEIKNPYKLKKKPIKIAILTSGITASSGEAIVIAFKGLSYTKSFGQKTAGLSTGNHVYELSDGAKLILTTTIMADRTKKLYGGQLIPDIPTNNPKAKAIEWLLEK